MFSPYFQLRKSHFPPRPKNKKHRQRRRLNRRKPVVVSTDDGSSSDCFKDSPIKLNNSKNNKRKHEDSAGDSVTSSSDSEIEEERKSHKRVSPKRRCIRSNTSMQDCASMTKQNLALKTSSDSCIEVGSSKSPSSSLESDFSLSLSKQSTNDITSLGSLGTLGNNNKKSTGICLQKFLGQHDSGISSQEVGSSQEFFFTDMKPAMLTRLNAQVLHVESCSGSDDQHDGLVTGNKNYNNQLKPSPLSATSSNCSIASVESDVSVATLRQTASDSDLIFNVESSDKQLQQQQQQSLLRPHLSERTASSIKDSDDSTICSLCCDNEKSAVFVHTTKACSGCCYTCAMKTWKRWKACPFCKEKAKNVIKLYSH